MKTRDCDILIIAGQGGAGPGHWLSRWQAGLPTARRVEQRDWLRPNRDAWVSAIGLAVGPAGRSPERPIVVVAHGLGVAALVHAVPYVGRAVRAAFLVAPVDVDRDDAPTELAGFSPLPTDPLPFPSMLIASRNDPFCDFERADEFAAAWGSDILDARNSGHIDGESGHGPWPEGLTRFATLLRRI